MPARLFFSFLIFLTLALIQPVQGQQATKIPRIGFLFSLSPDVNPDRVEAFRRGLRELGYEEASKERTDALLVGTSRILYAHRTEVAKLAAKIRLPAMYLEQEYVVAGGPMTYATSVANLYHRAATYVDKILKGARPADLPIEQPTTFEFIVNLKAAKQIGLTIPPNVLARADRVIR